MNKAVDRQFVVWRDRAEAAEAELERVRKENKEATRTKDQLLIAANIWQDRTEKAEAERDAMKAALVECAAPYSTMPGSVNECAAQIQHEFQRRMNIAGTAINASGTAKEGGT